MFSVYDLHTHSSASDGAHAPEQLVLRAKRAGVKTFALTDHDTVAGLKAARAMADAVGMEFINGIELSCQWDNKTIHIVGLDIDPDNTDLNNIITSIATIREKRAVKIGQKLAQVGIEDAYQNAKKYAGGGTLTRSHFAQYIVEKGHAENKADVFRKFLVNKKPGYVSAAWPDMEQAIAAIKSAGGIAVIAHPIRYHMTEKKLNMLIIDFKSMGGEAIEVVSGMSRSSAIQKIAGYALKYQIAASIGSDFHNEQIGRQLGELPPLPKRLNPVWELFKQRAC